MNRLGANQLFEKLGIIIPEILMPSENVELSKWSVIACDQYTSQPEYWEKVRTEVGESPSALNLVLPEAFLKAADAEARIKKINGTMERYLTDGILKTIGRCFILVERSTPVTPSRKGLILAIDLECYDYRKGSRSLIRATEETVLERIPPRVKIRENALVELPHIMLLIDDPEKTVIEPLYEKAAHYEKLYDFDLMMGGGHIKGWKINDAESFAMVADALCKLSGIISGMSSSASVPSSGTPCTKSGETAFSASDSFTTLSCISSEWDIPSDTLLFAVGDGNHSLAAAKVHWENVKASLKEQNKMKNESIVQSFGGVPYHPARYALVEVVNVHDVGLTFEPIHRILFGINSETIIQQLKNTAGKLGYDAEISLLQSAEAIEKTPCHHGNFHTIPFILEGVYGLLVIKNPKNVLEAGTLQTILDELAKSDEGIEIDYIHGDRTVIDLGSKKGCMGFFLPAMNKYDLFKTVKSDGVLPRKTFSMGEAEEKRYYLECRRIR